MKIDDKWSIEYDRYCYSLIEKRMSKLGKEYNHVWGYYATIDDALRRQIELSIENPDTIHDWLGE